MTLLQNNMKYFNSIYKLLQLSLHQSQNKQSGSFTVSVTKQSYMYKIEMSYILDKNTKNIKKEIINTFTLAYLYTRKHIQYKVINESRLFQYCFVLAVINLF